MIGGLCLCRLESEELRLAGGLMLMLMQRRGARVLNRRFLNGPTIVQIVAGDSILYSRTVLAESADGDPRQRFLP